MQRLSVCLLSVTAAVYGCSRDAPAGDKVVGTWVCLSPGGNSREFTFTKEGKYSTPATAKVEADSGEYKVQDNQLKLTSKDGSPVAVFPLDMTADGRMLFKGRSGEADTSCLRK